MYFFTAELFTLSMLKNMLDSKVTNKKKNYEMFYLIPRRVFMFRLVKCRVGLMKCYYFIYYF